MESNAAFLQEQAQQARSNAFISSVPDHIERLTQESDRLESIATKYESMARAVLWAYDKWVSLRKYGGFRPDRMAYGLAVEEATGKHPSDWTRDGLMEYLGIAQEADE